MANEDFERGFKAGFAAGLEEGKKLAPRGPNWNEILVGGKPSTSPTFEFNEKCPKCGISLKGVMGYVCSSPNCPTFPNITARTIAGAVGTSVQGYNEATGANGPAGGLSNGLASDWLANHDWLENGYSYR